jgi:Ser/Thr protein kinase RdoA (MazF antagonist)
MAGASNSFLSPEALLSKVLAHYDLKEPAECALLNSGCHDTFLVQTAGDPYVLKIYRRGFSTRADVLAEVDALLYLGRQGIPVALPVAKRDGGYAWSVSEPEGERQAVLFTFAKGRTAWPLDESSCRLLGRALARIHLATEGYTGARVRYDLHQLLEEPIRLHEPLLRERPEEWSYLQDLARRLREQIADLPAAALDCGFCHGEFNARHSHREEETGMVTTFDFEGCGAGYRAYDLAVFRFLLGWGRNDENPEPLWEAYLDGYTQHRPLKAIDREAIPLFVPMRPIVILANIIRTRRPPPTSDVPDPAFFEEMLKFLRAWDAAYLQTVRRP